MPGNTNTEQVAVNENGNVETQHKNDNNQGRNSLTEGKTNGKWRKRKKQLSGAM